MPDPITFATEADRLKALEQYVAVRAAIMGELGGRLSANHNREQFDRAFPPIKPPKMEPFTAYVVVGKESGKYLHGLYFGAPDIFSGERLAHVRVEEIEETP